MAVPMQDRNFIGDDMQLTPEEITIGVKSTLKGIKNGISNLIHTVKHPIDTLIYPVSKLAYDAAILSAAKLPNNVTDLPGTNLGDLAMMRQLINKNPKLYTEARDSMRNRINGTKQSFQDLVNAPYDNQIEALSSGLTTVWVPGQIFRGIKVISNVHEFGVSQPPKFHNRIWDDIPVKKPEIKYYSLNDVRNIEGTKALLYVYTQERGLLLADISAVKSIVRPARPHNGNMPLIDNYILHHDLAELNPVYASGNVLVTKGKIKKIDNESGHYRPQGDHLRVTVENAFSKAGYGEVKGKFNDVAKQLEWEINHNFTVDPIKAKKTPNIIAGMADKNKDEKITNLNRDYDIFPISANFELEEEQVQEFTTSANRAKEAQIEAINLLRREPMDSISFQTRATLLNLAEPMYQFGSIGLGLSQIALMTGGHVRTWKGINAACQGTIQLASSFTMIATAPSYMSLAACTGYIGAAIGVIGLAMSIFGDSGDDGMGQIMEGLNQIQQGINTIINILQEIHKTIVEGFHRLEEILVTTILTKLNQINNKLDRLEKITSFSFKELHSKELVDIIDIIKKDICGEYQLKDSKRQKNLQKLSTWIDCHSKAQIQTFGLRGSNNNGDIAKMVEIFSDPNINVNTILSLFLIELILLVPLLEPIIGQDIANLPNLDILLVACDVYIMACTKYNNIPKNENNVLTRAKDIINNINNILNKLSNHNYKDSIHFHEILLRQYDYYRLQVGFAIIKCREEWNKCSLAKTTLLGQALKPGQNIEILMNMLNEMEYRKIMLIKLYQLNILPQNGVYHIQFLESKAQILNYPLSSFEHDTKTWMEANRDGKLFEVKRYLEMGIDPNIENYLGKGIHYLTKYAYGNCNNSGKFKNHENTMLHLLFKYPEIQIHTGTKCDLGDTWNYPCTPILHSMNSAIFGLGILFCANGFDIDGRDGNAIPGGWGNFLNSHMGNCVQWSNTPTNVTCVLTVRFVTAMNDNNHIFNKTNLRNAYKYYKQIESGFLDINNVNINSECVLLLSCILGDLLPIKLTMTDALKNKLNILIPGIGLTYLMLACMFNQQQVANYLESLGASKGIKSDLALKTRQGHCFELSVICQSWLTAHLRNYGENNKEDVTKVQEMINKYFLGVGYYAYCQAPLYCINKENAPRLLQRLDGQLNFNNILTEAITRIDNCLNIPKNQLPVELVENKNKENKGRNNIEVNKVLNNCKLFARLLFDYIQKSGFDPELVMPIYDDLANILKIENPNLSQLSSTFNTLDGILKIDPNYKLGPNIEKLIKDIENIDKK
jgi:hypothetical protein